MNQQESSTLGNLDRLIPYLRLLWQKKYVIGFRTTAVVTAVIILVLLMPQSFRSTAILLPQNEDSQLGGGNLSGLASIAGINLGKSQIEQMFPDILLSETVQREVIYKKYQTKKFDSAVTLIEYWKMDGETERERFLDAYTLLTKSVEISVERKTSIVTITLLMNEPQLAADVVNTMVFELDKFLRIRKNTSASEQRKWIEQRLREVTRDLERSEDALKEFRSKNRVVTQSPDLLLEQQRMLRSVEINAAIFTELKKQFEIARINEIKNVPIVTVLDRAQPAVKKEKPQRMIIVIGSCLASLLFFSGYVIIGSFHHDLLNAVRQKVKMVFSAPQA